MNPLQTFDMLSEIDYKSFLNFTFVEQRNFKFRLKFTERSSKDISHGKLRIFPLGKENNPYIKFGITKSTAGEGVDGFECFENKYSSLTYNFSISHQG